MSKQERTCPTVIVDFGALDAEIADYVARGATSPSTRRAYADRWRRWEAHCAELTPPVDPWNAPASAFEELWLLLRDDGRPVSVNYVDGIASAVKHHCGGEDLTPAYRLPANSGRWRELRKAAKKRVAREEQERNLAGEGEDAKVVPLMRSDLVAMLDAPLPWTRQQLARRAAMLLYLHGVRPAVLDRLTRDDVDLGADGSVTVGGLHLPCDYRPRVPGVPWDCVACAVREVAIGVAPGGVLLDDGAGLSY